MTTDQKKHLVIRFVELMTTKQSDKFGEIISQDYKQHNPMVKKGLEGIQEGSKWFESIFPDISAHIDAIVVEGDIIVARISWSGTHKAELFGIPASNVKVTWTGTDWWRIENGKLVEHWDVVDWSSLMQQIQTK
ncbi:ester cyclase [Pedobacter psychrophilus]|nr:ester cyclase [Pedobacter psychrophilus]